MLELKNIHWALPDGGEILKGINLTVPDGRLTVVTGPNGGGKTSLAKVIAGLYAPSEGQILLDGEDVTGWDITERARGGIAYAFQQPVRFKGLTVRDLLELSAERTLKYGEICEYLGQVGLCAQEYVDREVNASLSGGESKRIELATVLARKNARMLVFDEPEAGIDLWSFARLTETFRELHEKGGRTILIISHQERIIRLADEIVLIANGEIAGRGTADELYPKLLSQTVAGCNLLEVNGTC